MGFLGWGPWLYLDPCMWVLCENEVNAPGQNAGLKFRLCYFDDYVYAGGVDAKNRCCR